MTITEKTKTYIKEHPYIKHCLKKGIINYSSLARLIALELDIGDTASKDSILIAARRYADKLKESKFDESRVLDYIKGSEMEIKNKMCMFIIKKPVNEADINDTIRTIRNEKGIVYFTEGSDFHKIITQEKYMPKINETFSNKILKCLEDLIIINIKMLKYNEKEPGIIAYISSLFAESDISIIDFIFCWTDSYIVIESKNLKKSIDFMKF